MILLYLGLIILGSFISEQNLNKGGQMENNKKNKRNEAQAEGSAGKKEFLPSLDFSSVVLPLYMPALINLGLTVDPVSGEPKENLEMAKRLIDILDLLKDRTKGNLAPEEETFLDSCLQQLKMHYLKKANIIRS